MLEERLFVECPELTYILISLERLIDQLSVRFLDASTKVAAIALANKIARMVWAMMAKCERYKEPVALAA